MSPRILSVSRTDLNLARHWTTAKPRLAKSIRGFDNRVAQVSAASTWCNAIGRHAQISVSQCLRNVISRRCWHGIEQNRDCLGTDDVNLEDCLTTNHVERVSSSDANLEHFAYISGARRVHLDLLGQT